MFRENNLILKVILMLKPKILVCIGCYLPGYKAGGPIRSVLNLVDALYNDFEFYIVTSDRDLGDSHAYQNIEYNCWNSVGKAKVWYLKPKQKSFGYIRKIMLDNEYDAIYLNGLWEKNATILPLIINRYFGQNKPVIQAVRGMLGNAAIGNKSSKKKMFLLFFYKLCGFGKRVTFQCSSDQEATEVRKNIGKSVRVATVWNAPGTDMVEKPVVSKEDNVLRMVFLSRISSKKNLDGALKSLSSVKSDVEYYIYGTNEDKNYWSECEEIIETLPKNVTVVYKGQIVPEKVINELSVYDCFYFPTHHENFGHVIHEALRSGLPALLSDKTPWHDLVMENAGWEFDDNDYEGFAKKIDELASCTADDYYTFKCNALQFAKRFSTKNSIIDQNREMFQQVIA